MKIGIIGYGYWGPNLVRNFLLHPEVLVGMVADSRIERLSQLKKTQPTIKTTTDALELINSPEIDAVVIATPVHTHFELAKKALLAGKHVLVEKPLASNLKEAEELVALAKEKKKILMVDHTYLYTGAVQAIKKLIDSGDIGDIQYFDSTRINLGLFQSDINVLWDLAPHDVSILLYLTGKKPKFVNALGASHTNNGIENIAYLTLRYENGMIANVSTSWTSPVKVRQILIGGNKKMVLFNDLEPSEKVRVYETGYELRTDEEKQNSYFEYRTGDVYMPKVSSREALLGMVEDFVQASTKGTTPLSSAEFGLDVVRILSAASESIKNSGKEIVFDK